MRTHPHARIYVIRTYNVRRATATLSKYVYNEHIQWIPNENTNNYMIHDANCRWKNRTDDVFHRVHGIHT